jgi:GT2 family glycosyltransferase
MLLIPRSRAPLVSVVLVTYGGWDWPYRALEALREHTAEPIEVICVDNASWDGTGDLLEELVGGATIVRNRHNRGFAAAANQGAALARAELLCFLNPDSLVRPGWLGPLRASLEAPGIGAAVPRFLGPDGRVQEAGSVVDRQGWTEAVGRGADPSDPETRFPRLVDYGSAACLLIRTETFRSARGFDEAFRPAYCEDVDLAFRLRESGLHTRYEPASAVDHAGAVSTGNLRRDRLIEANRRLLLRRWGHLLSDRAALTDVGERPHRLFALRDALAPDRLLVIEERGPQAAPLLAELAALPTTRVTVLIRGEAPAVAWEPLLRAGIEVATTDDVERWLAGRRYHYSVVAAGADVPAPVIRRWQPQAELMPLDGAPDLLAGALGAIRAA